MRDLILLGFIGVCLTAAIRFPYAGLLTWAWFTLMTPHQMAYGVFGLPLNTIIAGVTFLAWFFSGEAGKFRLDPLTGLIVLFAGWLTLSQQYSLDAENSAQYYDRFIKTLLFVVLCIQMTTTRLRFNALVWVLAIALGFYAVKGALFTLATLGQYRVQGLPNTILEDNNHFGIATATILPMLLYLRGQVTNIMVKNFLLAAFALSVLAVIGTHSRGAFVALVAFGGFFWLRAKHKAALAVGLIMLMIPAIAFMPSKWTERMTTITEATEDASFMGRVDAWVINYKLAQENPVTGAGLRNSYQKEIAMEVDAERAERAKAAHSIYFEILGGSGFAGLAIYLSIFAVAFFTAWSLYLTKNNPAAPEWRWKFGYFAQMSLVVFGVGGASTSMEMWDGYLVIIALVAAAANIDRVKATPTGNALAEARRRNWRRKKRLKTIPS